MSKHRSYSFTINNDTFEDLERLMDMDYKYIIFGFEEGEKGTPHIQGYVQYENPITFVSAKVRIGPRAHIEVSKGTPAQNIEYCQKEGSFYEFGEMPTTGGRLTKEQIEAAMKDPINNINIVRLYSKVYEEIKQKERLNDKSETQFYQINPEHDVIQEVIEYFNIEDQDDIVVVTSLSKLTQYDNPRVIIYDHDDLRDDGYERDLKYFPRGMPISIKNGYQWKTYKPDIFVLRTTQRLSYPLYKNI